VTDLSPLACATVIAAWEEGPLKDQTELKSAAVMRFTIGGRLIRL